MNIRKIIKEELLRESIEDQFERMVDDLLVQYGGGRPFFNALDDTVKDVMNRDIMLAVVKGLENEWVLSSGGFGDFLYNLYETGKFKAKGLSVFNGKMCTKRKGVTCWYPPSNLDDKEFVYVDDSLFSGNTVKKIDTYLRDYHNSYIKEVSVAYDGSREKNPIVKSLYRYYDRH